MWIIVPAEQERPTSQIHNVNMLPDSALCHRGGDVTRSARRSGSACTKFNLLPVAIRAGRLHQRNSRISGTSDHSDLYISLRGPLALVQTTASSLNVQSVAIEGIDICVFRMRRLIQLRPSRSLIGRSEHVSHFVSAWSISCFFVRSRRCFKCFSRFLDSTFQSLQ